MKRYVTLSFAGGLIATVLVAGGGFASPAAQAGAGTIKGHIRLGGKLPGNSVIRMGVDPKCSELNGGKTVVQNTVAAAIDGSLANVFVRLQGTFPQTPVPTTPVTVDQVKCVYVPRMVGVRVGQALQIKNSDALMHNVHSVSSHKNEFNVAQTGAGIVTVFRLKEEEVTLRLGCDIHRWMTGFVAVVTNPYFAVSTAAGTFEIGNVPPGTYTIQAWHERYGPITKSIKVTGGATTTLDLSYTGNEPAPRAGIEELIPPADVATIEFLPKLHS